MGSSGCFGCLICLIVTVVGIGVGLWLALGRPSGDEIKDIADDIRDTVRDFGDFTDVLGNLTDFVDEWRNDPFEGNSNITRRWANDGNGLTLEIQNALDDTWTTEFNIAVDDWENGNPDALTLPTSKIAIDRECSHKSGVIKVCDGNYGDTGWLGINEILSNPVTSIIKSSVAKMNEYYLLNADFDERRYTMCHEIGHGFGLPHTDENFYNRDLGDCLDYTSRPSNNLVPGTVNYQKLADTYGVTGGGRRQRRSLEDEHEEPIETTTTTTTSGTAPTTTTMHSLTPLQQAAYDAAMKELMQELNTPNNGRRLRASQRRGLRADTEQSDEITQSDENAVLGTEQEEPKTKLSRWNLWRSNERGRHYSRMLTPDLHIEVNILHGLH